MNLFALQYKKSLIATLTVSMIAFSTFIMPIAAHADVPDQDSCDSSGSLSYNWNDVGLDRPVVAEMRVDGESVFNPEEPDDGELGVSICPTNGDGRQVGLMIYRRDGMDAMSELTGAVTPTGGLPVDEDTVISITIADFGDFASHLTFALVHGVIGDWELSDAGTDDEALTFTIKPARTPQGTGPDFSFCTATPPNCNANKSDNDVITASVGFEFDLASTTNLYKGAYFGMVGAMGGFVTTVNDGNGNNILEASIGAPHFLEDGSTSNTGSLRAFLPDDVLENLGLVPGDVETESMNVERTEGDTTTTAAFTVTPTLGGVIVEIPTITFSTPVYSMMRAGLTVADPSSDSGSGATSGAGGTLPETGSNTTTQVLAALMLIGAGLVLARRRTRLLH